MKTRIAGIVAAALFAAFLVAAPAAPAFAGTGGVTGTVTRASNGTTMGSVAVTMWKETSPSMFSSVASTTTNGSGVFSFTTLDPGTYLVKYDPTSSYPSYLVEWSGGTHDFATSQSFTVTNGTSVQKSAALDLGAAIVGQVKGAISGGGSSALSGVSVRLYDSATHIAFQTTTDVSGNYRFEGLRAATYAVRFVPSGATHAPEWSAQGASYARAQKTLFPEGVETNLSPTLALTSSISGNLKDKDGNTVNGYVVVYDGQSTNDSSSNAVVTSVPTSGGNYTVFGLRPGQYKLAFTVSTLPGYIPTGPSTSTAGFVTQWWNAKYSVGTATQVTIVSGGGQALTGYNAVLENPAFADVQDPTSQFYEAIEWMFSTGISQGTAQSSGKPLYKPGDSVSRQSMAAFLYRLSGDTFTPPATATFADVPTDASTYTAIEWMAAEGISTGTPQPSGKPLFNPTAIVSRQSMAVFLARMAGVNTDAPSTTQVFADVPTTASTATAIKWMYDTGISTGTAQPSGQPLYKPADPVSRQAMALFLFRFDGLPS